MKRAGEGYRTNQNRKAKAKGRKIRSLDQINQDAKKKAINHIKNMYKLKEHKDYRDKLKKE